MVRVAQLAKRFSKAASLLPTIYNADVVGGEGVGGATLSFRWWATKKARGSTQNGRDSLLKNLGVKKYGGQVKFAKDPRTGRKWVHVEPIGGPSIHPAYNQQHPHPSYNHHSPKLQSKLLPQNELLRFDPKFCFRSVIKVCDDASVVQGKIASLFSIFMTRKTH